MAQFDFRAEPDVAGQQAERRGQGQAAQLPDEFPHSINHNAAGLRQHVIEPEHIGVEETTEILQRRFDLVLEEKLARQSRVGSARKPQPLRAVGDVELRGKCAAERLHSRASGANERAVDVEQDQSNHARG